MWQNNKSATNQSTEPPVQEIMKMKREGEQKNTTLENESNQTAHKDLYCVYSKFGREKKEAVKSASWKKIERK